MEHTRRNLLLYTIGRLVSLIGSGIQQIAIPLFILDLTGSGTIMGTFVLVSNLPRLVFSPFAGVIGDRFDRKKIMVYMDVLRGLLILSLAVFAILDSLTITVLLIVQFFVSTSDIIFDPATQAMIPDIVPSDQLTRTNSVIQGVNSFSYLVGPALGGVFYGLFGIKVVFIANGISFIASAISELFIVYVQPTKKEKLNVIQVFKDIRKGFAFFGRVKGLFMLLVFAMLSNFLLGPVFSVVFPYFARETVGFSGEQFGFLESTWVAGILLGNVILGTFLSKKSPAKLFKIGILSELLLLIGFFSISVPAMVNFFGGPSWLYFSVIGSVFAFTGAFNALVNTPLTTMFHKKTPTEYRSRVFSVVAMLAQLATPLGAMLYGYALDLVEPHWLFLVATVGNGVLTVVFLALNMERVLEEPRASAG